MKMYTGKLLASMLILLSALYVLTPIQYARANKVALSGQKSVMLSEPRVFLEEMVSKYKEGKYQEALQEIEAYLTFFLCFDSKDTPDKSRLDLTWKARFLFLAGYIYLQQGEFSKSSETWNRLITVVPSFILNDYAHYYLGESYRKQGRYPEALKAYQSLIHRYPSSLLQPDSQFKLARVLALEKKYSEAIDAYSRFLKKFPNHPLASRALWDSGRALEEQKNFKTALNTYSKLQKSYPYSFWAAQAQKREKEIFTQHPHLIPRWNDQKLYSEGERLYKLSLFSQAKEVLNRLVQEFPGSPLLEQTLVLLGRTQYSLRENEAALKTLEGFLARYPQSKSVPLVLHTMARIHLRLGEGDKFLATYRRLHSAYPKDKWTLDTLYLLGTYYEEDLQDFKKALDVYNHFLKKSLPGSRREDTLWRMAWIHYRSGEYQKARKILLELIEKYPDSYYFEEALYWTGKASEKLEDWRKAIESFQRVRLTKPRSYYGARSINRLETLFKEHPELKGAGSREPQTGNRRSESTRDNRQDVRIASRSTSSGYLTAPEIWEGTGLELGTKAQELKRLALYREAARELEKTLLSGKKKTPPSPEIYQLLGAYYGAGDYRKSVQLSRRYFWNWLSQDGLAGPDHFWKMAYPLGYERLVKRYITSHMDPFLVYAIIMAESQFNAEVRSPAGAVGLMQIIYDTGQRLAQNMGITAFSEEMLLNVELNIALGVSYLEELLTQFKGDMIPVIASYNAGEDRVEIWLRRIPEDDPEMFVASIPYRETKKYVQRVLWYYEEYRRIYGNP